MAQNAFMDAVAGAAKTGVCQALGASEQFGNAVVYAWQQFTGLNDINPPNFAALAKSVFCGEPAPTLPPGTSAPQGAQCDCVVYRLYGQLERTQDFPLVFSGTRVWGPILGFQPVSGGFLPPQVTTYNVICKGPANQPCGSATIAEIGAGDGSGQIKGVTIFRIEREDGGPDNCGSGILPVPTPLPDIGITLPDINFSFNPSLNPSLTINAIASIKVFQPIVNFNGQLVVPVNITANLDLGGVNFNIDASVNLNTGDINFNFGGGNSVKTPGVDSPCEDPDEPVRTIPDDPPDVPPPPEDPDVEEVDVIVGVIVTVTSVTLTNKATVINQGPNPDIYAPSLGFINFYCPVSESGRGGWTPDQPVKNRQTLIPCPWPDGASGVNGTPNAGVTWQLTPIRKKIQKRKEA